MLKSFLNKSKNKEVDEEYVSSISKQNLETMVLSSEGQEKDIKQIINDKLSKRAKRSVINSVVEEVEKTFIQRKEKKQILDLNINEKI